MELDLKWLLGVLGLIVGVVSTKILDRWFNEQDAERDEIAKLTIAMTELKVEIKHLSEKLSPMPKIQQDLNELHGKVRAMSKQ
jgi:uncharacterized membrane-anchored protein YhcB (DUF1043 family)